MRLGMMFVAAGLLCIVLGAARGSTARTAAERWDVLLITADDLNGDSMGWMGSKVGATPDVDAFAATCSRITQMHVSAPICQPSRGALMTGRVPHRNGALGFNPIRTDVPTLPETLKTSGYFTSAINKIAHMQPREKFPWDLALDGSGKNPTALAAHLAQALKAAGDAGKSFFINANITDPHRPFYGSAQGVRQRQVGRARDEGEVAPYAEGSVPVPSFLEDLPLVRKEVAQYYSSVHRMNATFAGLLAELEKSGAAAKTVVIFMSDHGMSFPFSKASVYRNGTWTPFLIRWPGMGKPVVVKDAMVSSVDVMPSLLELLQITPPAGMDGRSFVPLLRGETQAGRDFVITHVNTVSSGKSFPQRCVRSRTRSYMYHAWSDGTTPFRVEAMNGLTWNALSEAGKTDPRIAARAKQFQFRTREEFFDLETDPDERKNLIDAPQHAAEIRAMRQRLLEHMRKTGDPEVTGVERLMGVTR